MAAELPPELAALLDGADPVTREGAWEGFLARYHRLLLKAASRFGGDYDARMDRYRHLLDTLAAEDYRRLRAYRATAHSSFPSWLTVVAGRLCVDFERSRHGRGGRARAHPEAAAEERRTRRRLTALVGGEVRPDDLEATDPAPDGAVREAELHAAVEAGLATLDAQDRLLIRLRYDDGLSVAQIADVMGYPTVFHVYRSLRAVLATLRRHLESRGISEGTA